MKWRTSQWVVTVLSPITLAVFFWVGANYSWWQGGVAVLSIAIVATIFPVVLAFLGFGELYNPGEWFDTAEQLGDQQKRIIEHYSRIQGTLRFWKSKSAAHYRLHFARIIWSLVAAVSLPVLVQVYDKADTWSVLFMTLLTTWTGLIVALAFTLKSEQKYQGFRQQESDFYDTSRELLDFAKRDDPDLEKRVDEYIKTVNSIRKIGRRVETSSPPSAL